MIVRGVGETSLGILSDTLTSAEITRVVGLEPTEAEDKGAVRLSGLVAKHTSWILDAPDGHPEDEHHWASVGRLIDLIEPRLDGIATLVEEHDIRVNWGGESDATQGGFSLPAELLTKLGRLGAAGVYLWGTVYLDIEGEAAAEAASGDWTTRV